MLRTHCSSTLRLILRILTINDNLSENEEFKTRGKLKITFTKVIWKYYDYIKNNVEVNILEFSNLILLIWVSLREHYSTFVSRLFSFSLLSIIELLSVLGFSLRCDGLVVDEAWSGLGQGDWFLKSEGRGARGLQIPLFVSNFLFRGRGF